MKLIICLFLIVVILEEYNCAPHVRTKGRHRHHHDHRPSRSHTSYRCRLYCTSYNGHYRSRYYSRFGYGTHQYHPKSDLTYGSRSGSRHGSWHRRHGYHADAGCRHGSDYGTRPFIQNITPVHETVEKPVVEKPATVDKSVIVGKPEEKPATVDKSVTVEKPEEKPIKNAENKSVIVESITVAKSVAVDKSVTVTNLIEMPVNKPKDVAVDDSVDRTVYPSVDQPVDKPFGNVSDKPMDNNIPSTNSAESSSENLSDYSTVNSFHDMPTENLLDIATEYPFTVTEILT